MWLAYLPLPRPVGEQTQSVLEQEQREKASIKTFQQHHAVSHTAHQTILPLTVDMPGMKGLASHYTAKLLQLEDRQRYSLFRSYSLIPTQPTNIIAVLSISAAFKHSIKVHGKFMVWGNFVWECHRCTLKLTTHTNHKFPTYAVHT